MIVYVNKKEKETLSFILAEFINLHIADYDIYKADIDAARSFQNKLLKAKSIRRVEPNIDLSKISKNIES